MRVLFLWPGATLPGFESLKVGGSNEATYVNHGLCAISAVLKEKGHECWLVDLRGFRDWRHYEQVIRDQQFDLAAIGFMSCDSKTAEQMCQITKSQHPDRPIIAGGVHLSVTRSKTFPYADHVIWGEGDFEVLKMVEQYERGEKPDDWIQADPILDLDLLPHEDRELFNNSMETETPLLPALPKPFVTAIFSRGCPYRCSFCAPSRELIFGKQHRFRSVPHIIEELVSIQMGSGIGSLMIHDDLFCHSDWMEDFIDSFGSTMGYIPFWCQMRADWICKYPELIEGLAGVGLTWVSIGLEAGSPRMLKFLKKGVTVAQNIEACEILHRNDVNIFANYIMGLPTERPEDLDATVKMLEKIKPEWHAASTYTAYPGSYLFEYCTERELFTDEHYSQIRFPYERKVRGVDYNLVRQKQGEAARHSSPVRDHSHLKKKTVES